MESGERLARWALGLVLLTAAAMGAKFSPTASKCSSCRFLVRTFYDGVEKTAGRKWTGGDAHWEAEKLGKYETSETRLVEIMESVCKKRDGASDTDYGLDALQDNSGHKCHQFLESYEEELENWYFHKQRSEPDLRKYLCEDKVKVCCPDGQFGQDCQTCPGVAESQKPCFGRGTCDGEGTRGGEGTCSCFAGYQGKLCRHCSFNYVATEQNDSAVTCEACHEGCQGGCSAVGPQGCAKCKDGWGWVDTKGCQDVDECEEAEPCEEEANTKCVNKPGSYECACQDGFKKMGAKCEVDVEAAMKKVEEEADKEMVEKLKEQGHSDDSTDGNDSTEESNDSEAELPKSEL